MDSDFLRFSYEGRLFNSIKTCIGHIPLIDHSQSRELLNSRRRDLLGDAVRVTADLLPEIHEIYRKCLRKIGGGLSGDLFVQQSSIYNANVFSHNNKFDILIHSALLNDFSLAELSFVFGHELGHVILKHSLFPALEIIELVKNHDPAAAQLLFKWTRASEISADRVGMLCCGNLGSAATALFKTSSGLSNIDADRALRSLRNQYEELEQQIKSVHTAAAWVRTHPMIPIRFKALELAALDIIALSKNNAAFSAKGFRSVDQQISSILEVLDAYTQ